MGYSHHCSPLKKERDTIVVQKRSRGCKCHFHKRLEVSCITCGKRLGGAGMAASMLERYDDKPCKKGKRWKS